MNARRLLGGYHRAVAAVARAGSNAPPAEYQQITFRTGAIGNARFTPDGSIVYSASWEDGGRQLYMARTNDHGARELGLKDAGLGTAG